MAGELDTLATYLLIPAFFSFQDLVSEDPEIVAISTELSEDELELVLRFFLSGTILLNDLAQVSPVLKQMGVSLETLDLVKVI